MCIHLFVFVALLLLQFFFFIIYIFFGYLVESRVRANTQLTARGHETRGEGVGRTKQWGTETLGDLWKGKGWDGEHGE